MGLFDFLKDAIIVAGADHMMRNKGKNNHRGYDPCAWRRDYDHEDDSLNRFFCDEGDF
jgi:hypothetical protein